MDRQQVFQPLEALGLKPPLPFIEAGPVQPTLAAHLGVSVTIGAKPKLGQVVLWHKAEVHQPPRLGLPSAARDVDTQV